MNWSLVLVTLICCCSIAHAQQQLPLGREPERDYVLTEMRLQTTRGFEYLYVSAATTIAQLGETIGRLMPAMEQGKKDVGALPAGPVVFRYRANPGGEPGSFVLDVGQVVEEGATASGDVKVEPTGDFACASAVFVGHVRHMGQANGDLRKRFQEAGLGAETEYREVYLNWDGDNSSNNVAVLQLGLADRTKAPPVGNAEPAVTISPMRIREIEAHDYLFAEAQTTLAGIGAAFAQLVPKYTAAVKQLGLAPEVERATYVGATTDPAKPFTLQVGQRVPAGTKPTDDTKVRSVDAFYCASTVFTGGVPSLGQAINQLTAEVNAAGLKTTTDYREHYLYWEDFGSPNNIMMILIGIEDPAQDDAE